MKRAISKKSRIAKIVGIVSALTIAVVTVFTLALTGAAVVSEAEAIAADMAMTDGANIRVGADGTGIRFETTVTKNDAYKAAFPNGFDAAADVKFGTIIIPESLLGTGKLDHTNEDILDIPAQKVWSEDENKMVYTAVLADIPFSWYGEDIVALSYVKAGGAYAYVGIDGEADAPVVRSYSEVAVAAYKAGDTTAAVKQVAITPVTLPNGTAIDGYKLVTDFDNGLNDFRNYQDNINSSLNRGYGTFVDTESGAALGDAFKITAYKTATGDFAAATHQPWSNDMILKNAVDVTGYKGVFYYIDTTGLSGPTYDHDRNADTAIRLSASVMLNMKDVSDTSVIKSVKDDTKEAVSRAEFNKGFYKKYTLRTGAAYYYDNGAWVATSPTDKLSANAAETYGKSQYFMSLPANYVGYVYVPFETYNVGDQDWATLIATNKYLVSIELRVNHCDIAGSVIFDNIYIVK